jgi:hypothetical protein
VLSPSLSPAYLLLLNQQHDFKQAMADRTSKDTSSRIFQESSIKAI